MNTEVAPLFTNSTKVELTGENVKSARKSIEPSTMVLNGQTRPIG
jgi:hypothetical protein